MSKPSIIFRADGNTQIGLGHLVRSSALAAMLKEQYHCTLATRCDLQSLLTELKQVFCEIVSLPQNDYTKEAEEFDALATTDTLIVLDGYNFDAAYQDILNAKGFSFFSIDDIHASPFYSKVVINHSGGLSPFDYHALPATQFYLGLQYALLRKPFLEVAQNRRTAITDRNCFICFGGADPNNKTLEVLQDISSKHHSFDHVHVVAGSAYHFRQELEAFVKGQTNLTLHFSLSTEEMIAVMQQCSFAICSPSTVVYEYLSVGGIVFLEQIADNQKDVIRYFVESGIAFRLNQLGTLCKEQLENSFVQQTFYFDGNSGERLRKLFRQYFDGKGLTIRKAKAEDIEICFNWVNDPEVRKQSYNQTSIALHEHTRWFLQKLGESNSYYYIFEKEGKPVGQIRFQVTNNEAVLGYLIGAELRSQGMGSVILGKGIEQFLADYQKPVEITGYVKESNIPSQRSFERFAFRKERAVDYPDSFKYTMTYGD